MNRPSLEAEVNNKAMEDNNKQALEHLKKARELLSSLRATPRVKLIDSLIAEIPRITSIKSRNMYWRN